MEVQLGSLKMKRRWMVSGREVARMVREFEEVSVLRKNDPLQFRHHEDTPAFQKRFKEHYQKFVAEFEKARKSFYVQR